MDPNRRIQVAVGIVVEAGRVLIARRPEGVPLAGYWEFPGGKLEPGETPERAAERELAEELSIVVRSTGRLTVREHAYPHGTVVLTPVLCRRLAGDPVPVQVAECRWVELGAVASYTFPAGNAAMLMELLALPLQPEPSNATVADPLSGD